MGRKNPKNNIINQTPQTTDLTAVVDLTDLVSIDKPVPLTDINKIAIRRGKVRELSRMGYDAHQIVLILDKGIKVNDQFIKVPISEQTVKADIEYIRQEDAAVDIEFPEKRAEVIDKLRFLYQQAIKEYINAKGAVKNSFLNTGLSILNRIAEIEGLDNLDAADSNINAEAKISKYATEIQALGKEEKNVLITAIRQVLGKRQQESTGDNGIPSKQPSVPTQTSDNEGISGES